MKRKISIKRSRKSKNMKKPQKKVMKSKYFGSNRKKSNRLKFNEEMMFSINKVQFPKDFEKEYKAIRQESISNDNDDEDDEDGGGSKNSLSRQIKKGSISIIFDATVYDKNMAIKGFFKVQHKAKRKNGSGGGSSGIVLTEPYVLYKGKFIESSTKYADYCVTDVGDMRALPFHMNRYGLERLRYMFLYEIGMRSGEFEIQVVKKLKKLTNNKNGVMVKESHMKALGNDLYDAYKTMTMHYLLRNVCKIIKKYTTEKYPNGCIQFKTMLFAKFNLRKFEILNDIVTKTPHMLSIPTICKNLGLLPINHEELMEIEKIAKKDLGSFAGSFEDPYYWACHLYKTIKDIELETKGMYTDTEPVMWRLRENCRRIYSASKMDCVVKKMQKMNTDQDVMDFVGSDMNVDIKKGFDLLIKHKCIFINKVPKFGTIDEQKIYKTVKELLTSIQNSENENEENNSDDSDDSDVSLFGSDSDDDDVDTKKKKPKRGKLEILKEYQPAVMNIINRKVSKMYKFKKGNKLIFDRKNTGKHRSFNQKIYTKETWDQMQTILTQIRLMMIRNRLQKNNRVSPIRSYKSMKSYTKLNERQRMSVDVGVGSKPLNFCEGPPGAGKTEVANTICDALDKSEYCIAAVTVNGISRYVLDRRIRANYGNGKNKPCESQEEYTEGVRRTMESVDTLFDPTKNYDDDDDDDIQPSRKCKLLTMTMNMIVSKNKSHNAEDFKKFIGNVRVLLIDEIQNVDLNRLSKLLPLLTSLEKIIGFGDWQQIHPICIGSILKDMFDAVPLNWKVELTENNRVKKYPNSQSIVKNVQKIRECPYFNINYTLSEDDEGTEFVSTSSSREASNYIIDMYLNSTKDTFYNIAMITPTKELANIMNNRISEIIRQDIVKKTNWKKHRDVFKIPLFFQKLVKIGMKLKITQNYKSVKILLDKRSRQKMIIADEVFNGEIGFVKTITKHLTINGKTIYAINFVDPGVSDKIIILGGLHVGAGDIACGFFTTIDAMLGGQNKRIVFLLGLQDSINNKQCSIFRNLYWVTRDRIISAISRAAMKLIVMAPTMEITTAKLMTIMQRREDMNGRRLTDENIKKFTEQQYTFTPQVFLQTMADFEPRFRSTDVSKFARNILKIYSE